ncbi:hypothetical protein PV433_29115 [Paenibacillus sp. GYB004]|uniref:hypothetical protein n=1 Tax=Paenibacillus sp. GYB004 TaxID=2994393 RepID=UPI002F965812
MALNTKTLENVFRPILNPLVYKVLRPLREAKKLPGILIKKFQAAVKGIIGTRETSLKNYVAVGSYYVSKRLLVVAVLIVLVLSYFLFIKPPALVNKWFNRVPVVIENSPKAMTVSGQAKVVDQAKQPRYTGGLEGGLYMGSGKLYSETGSLLYEGEFDKGLKQGGGSLYDGQGKLLYKGQFAADQYNGPGTLFQVDRKIRYTGEFQNGKFGGAGKLYADNGSLLYEGLFLENMYHGAGKLFGQNGQIRYEGEFAAGEFNGTGKQYDELGRLVYEGAFKGGRYSGEGAEYNPATGLVKYKGQFAAGAYAGSGELSDDNGVVRLKGTFRGGLLTGTGEAYDASGKPLYKGDFVDGLYDGVGTLLDSAGTPVLKSFFEQGRISLQSFIGLPSKKIEELLGKPGEVALLDQVQPLDMTAAGNASAGTAGTDRASAAAGAGAAVSTAAADTASLKFQLHYPDYQMSFLAAPSKSNPKEAVVSEVSVWGSKPLSVLQPGIETFNGSEKTNAEGYTVLELRASAPGGMTVNRYYRGDYLYELTFNKGESAAFQLDISAIERAKR